MLRHKEGNPLPIGPIDQALVMAPLLAGQALDRFGKMVGNFVDNATSRPIGRRGGALLASLGVATLLAGAIPSRPDPNRKAGLGVNTAYAQESDRLPGVAIYPSPDEPGVMIVDALLQKGRGLLIGGEPFTTGSVNYANRLGDRCIPYAAVYFADVPHRIQAEVTGTVHVERLDAPDADYDQLKEVEDPTNPLKGTEGGPIVQNLRRAINQINAELQQDGGRKAPEVMVGGYIVSQANGEPSMDPVVRPMFIDATLDQVADPGSRCEETAPAPTVTAAPSEVQAQPTAIPVRITPTLTEGCPDNVVDVPGMARLHNVPSSVNASNIDYARPERGFNGVSNQPSVFRGWFAAPGGILVGAGFDAAKVAASGGAIRYLDGNTQQIAQSSEASFGVNWKGYGLASFEEGQVDFPDDNPCVLLELPQQNPGVDFENRTLFVVKGRNGDVRQDRTMRLRKVVAGHAEVLKIGPVAAFIDPGYLDQQADNALSSQRNVTVVAFDLNTMAAMIATRSRGSSNWDVRWANFGL